LAMILARWVAMNSAASGMVVTIHYVHLYQPIWLSIHYISCPSTTFLFVLLKPISHVHTVVYLYINILIPVHSPCFGETAILPSHFSVISDCHFSSLLTQSTTSAWSLGMPKAPDPCTLLQNPNPEHWF
jgi:hypothetical protein